MKKNRRKKYRIIVWGGLGDALLLTPTFNALKLQEPKCTIIVYSNKIYNPILLNNPNIDKIITLVLLKNHIRLFYLIFRRNGFHFPAYGLTKPSLFYRNLHATEVIGKMIGIDIIDKQVQVFITKDEDKKAATFLGQYKNPILIQITSNYSSNQNWPVEKWEELIRRMPEYTFLQLGNHRETKVKGAIDLLGKTTLRESMAMLKSAQSFVVVVSFLNHASNAFLKKGVVLFGASTPQNWGYSHNINIYKKTPCSPCVDLLRGNPCPYNSECIQKITPKEVQEALETQLGVKKELEHSVKDAFHSGRYK